MTATALHFTRRDVLKITLMMGGVTALSPLAAFAQQPAERGGTRSESPSALALARLLTRTKFADLPPKAVMHAKMSLASTLACAAAGVGRGLDAHHPRPGKGERRQAGCDDLVRRNQAPGQ